jgi:hypothetical protein
MTYYNIEELKQLVLCTILNVSRITCPLHGTRLCECRGWCGDNMFNFFIVLFN